MKSIKLKKIIIFLISALFLSSCSSEKTDNMYKESKQESTEISSADADPNTFTVSENDRDSSGFSQLKSGEYASAMKEEHFVLTYYIPDHKIKQTISVDNGNVFSEFSDPGVSYKIIFLHESNKQYMIVDDCYCETSVSDTPKNIIKIYSDLEYVSSGTEDKDGEILNYDEFRQKQLGSSILLLTDDEGNFTAFDQSGTLAEIEYFSTSADKSLFVISKDYKKVSEDEIRKAIEAQIASQNR